jgi:outer membrane lipoprotein carrier protein
MNFELRTANFEGGLRPAVLVLVVMLSTAGLALPVAQQAPTTDGAGLAARLQTRYEAIRDFTADFSQTYVGRLKRRTATERGKVQVKKPYRIRFTYESPEKKEFVSDGKFFYSYFQSERTGSRQALPKEDEASMALLFLAGRGNLARDFKPSLDPKAPAGETHLQLVPKKPQADFETLTLIVDSSSLALKGFITTDDQGTSTVRFTNLRENPGVPDTVFNFTFPKGTEIIR